jgi:hypothetical protein
MATDKVVWVSRELPALAPVWRLIGAFAQGERMEAAFLERLAVAFPDFAAKLGDGTVFGLEHIQPPASEDNLRKLEQSLGVPLPESYKSLMRCGRELWLLGGVVQFGFQHPFFHNFEPLDKLTPQQRRTVQQKGGAWPPPSQGMLCFAEFFMEADGDQVLFDVSGGLVKGEYPVLYYAHEGRPPSVRRLADAFPEFLSAFLDYPAFVQAE